MAKSAQMPRRAVMPDGKQPTESTRCTELPDGEKQGLMRHLDQRH
jgi:hypothetical protein